MFKTNPSCFPCFSHVLLIVSSRLCCWSHPLAGTGLFGFRRAYLDRVPCGGQLCRQLGSAWWFPWVSLYGFHFLCGCVWKCCVPLNPLVLLIIIPIKWLFHWEYIPYFQTNPFPASILDRIAFFKWSRLILSHFRDPNGLTFCQGGWTLYWAPLCRAQNQEILHGRLKRCPSSSFYTFLKTIGIQKDHIKHTS